MKQKIVKYLFGFDHTLFNDESIESVIDDLQFLLDDCRKLYPEFETFVMEYDYSRNDFNINGVRQETDDEYQERLKTETAGPEQEGQEYELYQKLKAKFER